MPSPDIAPPIQRAPWMSEDRPSAKIRATFATARCGDALVERALRGEANLSVEVRVCGRLPFRFHISFRRPSGGLRARVDLQSHRVGSGREQELGCPVDGPSSIGYVEPDPTAEPRPTSLTSLSENLSAGDDPIPLSHVCQQTHRQLFDGCVRKCVPEHVVDVRDVCGTLVDQGIPHPERTYRCAVQMDWVGVLEDLCQRPHVGGADVIKGPGSQCGTRTDHAATGVLTVSMSTAFSPDPPMGWVRVLFCGRWAGSCLMGGAGGVERGARSLGYRVQSGFRGRFGAAVIAPGVSGRSAGVQ